MSKLFPTAVIGSMPRPKYVQDLINPELNKNVDSEDYQKKLQTAIKFIIQFQEGAGIDIISDGEWRRLSYVGVIADLLNGFERTHKNGLWWHTVTNKVSLNRKNLFADEAKFILESTKCKVKVALPSPFLIGARMWNEEKSRKVYPSRYEFMKEIAKYLKDEIIELKKAGVSIIQIDDPNLCLFVDSEYRKKFDNPEAECEQAVGLINDTVNGIDDIQIALHLCRSSGTRSRQIATQTSSGFVGKGNYDFILPYLQKLKVNQFAMEFANSDAGSYSVLEHLPKNAKIGFGCVDVGAGIADTSEKIAERVENALQYTSKEKIILNPDCGFAPGNQANVSLDEAYVKLKEMAKAAEILRKKYG